ncbi:MAG: S8 family serine peptidase [Bacteroidetes bacterium]|nr:S8 family serine peptidase [Bacteroidota bacterium]
MKNKVLIFNFLFFTRIKFFICFLLLAANCLFSFSSFAQSTKYWIQFADKNNSPYSILAPSAFLSSRALQRRAKQGIAVVQNDLPVNPVYIDSIRKIPNVTVLNHSKWFNGIVIYTTDTNAVNQIKKISFVANSVSVKKIKSNQQSAVSSQQFEVENYNVSKIPISSNTKLQTPNSNFSSGYNYGPSFNQINMLNGICLHDKGFHGEGMIIAMMDAGFWRVDSLTAFDSLRMNKQIIAKWNFVDNDSLVYGSHKHGERTLSTMGANLPGQLVGTAPKAQYLLFITEETPSESIIEEYNWASAAEFADSAGADIFNTSLGYTLFDSVKIDSVMVVNPADHSYADMNGHTTPIAIATNIAASKGILPVCSAGNMGGSPWHFIGTPADADGALTVGAVDSMGNSAGFSSRGPSYDGRIKPNVVAQGQDVVISNPDTTAIEYSSGTSFASPILAGMAACLWQAHPTSANVQLLYAIQQSASQYGKNPDSQVGYGIPDFCLADVLLGINDFSAGREDVISVYPNPFSDELNISFVDWIGEKVIFSLSDITGRKILDREINMESNVSTFEINDTDWIQSGVYILTAQTEKQKISIKVIKY